MLLRRLGWIALCSWPAAAAVAHHGVAAYDMRAVLTIDGVVDTWRWQSPHTSLTLRIGDRNETFVIEGAPPRWMEGQGWAPESLAAGEAVTVTYHPARREGGDYAAILMEVRRANGAVLKVNRPASLGGP
jgi:hypothetical protein